VVSFRARLLKGTRPSHQFCDRVDEIAAVIGVPLDLSGARTSPLR
jgi:hypothetical protein